MSDDISNNGDNAGASDRRLPVPDELAVSGDPDELTHLYLSKLRLPVPDELAGLGDPDELTRFALSNLEIDRQKAEIDRLKIENEALRQDIEERRSYGKKVLLLTISWLFIVLLIVLARSIGWIWLSDQVIMTLIGSTTANIIGLMVIVLKYIFRTQSPSN